MKPPLKWFEPVWLKLNRWGQEQSGFTAHWKIIECAICQSNRLYQEYSWFYVTLYGENSPVDLSVRSSSKFPNIYSFPSLEIIAVPSVPQAELTICWSFNLAILFSFTGFSCCRPLTEMNENCIQQQKKFCSVCHSCLINQISVPKITLGLA